MIQVATPTVRTNQSTSGWLSVGWLCLQFGFVISNNIAIYVMLITIKVVFINIAVAFGNHFDVYAEIWDKCREDPNILIVWYETLVRVSKPSNYPNTNIYLMEKLQYESFLKLVVILGRSNK